MDFYEFCPEILDEERCGPSDLATLATSFGSLLVGNAGIKYVKQNFGDEESITDDYGSFSTCHRQRSLGTLWFSVENAGVVWRSCSLPFQGSAVTVLCDNELKQ